MKLDLNKFYNTNYKDFVHKEAVEEALKLVPEVELKDVEIDNILSITFSVDEFGENPMYIEYLGKDGKKHLVRIRLAVSNEIQELLKRYVTLEQHETDKQDIYNHFEHIHVPMELRSANELDEEGNREVVLNNDNSFISFQVDPETDNEIQWLCIHNKGGLGSQSMYFARFVDFAKVDEVPSNADFVEKVQELEEKMNTADNRVLEASKEYTDSTITSLGDELNAKIEKTKNDLTLIIGESEQDTLQQAKVYSDAKYTEYIENSKRYTDNSKKEAINDSKAYTDSETDETLIASKDYTDTKHTEVIQHVSELENDMNTNFATKQELMLNIDGLCEYTNNSVQTLNDRIDTKATVYTSTEGQNTTFYHNTVTFEKLLNDDITFKPDGRTAPTYGYLLNEPQLTKLKNLPEKIPEPGISEEQLNTKLNNYLLKNKIKYNDGEFSKINFVHGTDDSIQVHDNSGNLSMTGKFITPSEKNSIADYVEKTSELGSHKITNTYWYHDDKAPNYARLLVDGDYLRTHIESEKGEVVTYTPTFKSAKQGDLINKTNSFLWDTIEQKIINFEEGNEIFYDVAGDNIVKLGVKNKFGAPQKMVRFDQFMTLENLASVIGNPQPIDMNVSYNGSVLELNNYSTFTTIGDTTIVSINCNFTAPFNSGTTPILNTLTISSEKLKSFPTFMMDCIAKTATNVSSYTTTTVFSNKISNLYVETPVIEPNETIATSLISFNGSYIFNNTKEAENNE